MDKNLIKFIKIFCILIIINIIVTIIYFWFNIYFNNKNEVYFKTIIEKVNNIKTETSRIYKNTLHP